MPRKRTQATQAAPRLRSAESEVRLSPAELEAFAHAIAELAGAEFAEEALFRVGRQWGRRQSASLEHAESPLARIRRGVDLAARLGLARVTFDEVLLDPKGLEFRARVRVLEVREPGGCGEGAGEVSGALCGLTVGFLTGLATDVTGIDLVCSPFHCQDACPSRGCRYEIRPAHSSGDEAHAHQAPSGSARFFLGSLGRFIADSDISLDDLVENTSDAMILLDAGNVVRYWNRGAESMFGWRREEVVGRPAGFIVPADLLAADELGRIQRVLDEQAALNNHISRRVRKDGKVLDVSVTRTRLHDARGRTVGSTAIIRDITEQRRSEQELQRSRGLAVMGELSAKIAHEIKNPLAGIYAAVQLLGRDVPSSDPRREVFDEIGREIRRLDETVQDLLHYARPHPSHPYPTDLGTFVRDLLEPLRRQPDVQRHRVRVDIAEGVLVPLDARMMNQALTNVILNAAQAMEGEPGFLDIVARCEEGRVTLEIRDTGPGIAPEVRGTLFEPFCTTKSRGTGLGLAIARKNVEALGGTIEALENHPRGALFRIVLPARMAE